jgi:hypothetical protein
MEGGYAKHDDCRAAMNEISSTIVEKPIAVDDLWSLLLEFVRYRHSAEESGSSSVSPMYLLRRFFLDIIQVELGVLVIYRIYRIWVYQVICRHIT